MYGVVNGPNLDKDSSQIVVTLWRVFDVRVAAYSSSAFTSTAVLLHACIDDNVDMVTFLVEHGASINQPDNEGWIPLHAAASCGYLDIAEYLISQGANVGVVNSEGETPLDIAEEEAMEELLQNEINRQGVDIEAARKEEERIMLRDARQWLNSGQIQDIRHAKSGGTALHVAAAKGYVEGQTPFDVADEDVLGYLEELQKRQNLLMSEKKDVKKSPLIETTTTGDNNQSLKPLKSKETLLLEPEKSAPRIETLEAEKEDEGEEGKKDESSCSSEEEEEEDSESETEAGTVQEQAVGIGEQQHNTRPNQYHRVISNYPNQPGDKPHLTGKEGNDLVVTQPAGKVSTKVEEERKDESPASWRLGLRKTGSYGALAEITATKEAQREKDTTGVMRSASSPRLSSSLDNKDKEKEKDKGTRLAYVAPTIPRRLASTSDIDEKENRDSTALIRSGSYTRRRWDDDMKNSEGSASTNRTSSYQRSGSFGRRHDDLSSSTTSSSTTTTTSSSVTSPTGHRGLLSSLGSSSTRTGSTSLTSRYWSEESAEKEKESAAVIPTINTGSTTTTASTTTTTAISTTTTTTGTVTGERRRSYLTPVRDEESESQRKARSRQARQSRRSTQVTLSAFILLLHLCPFLSQHCLHPSYSSTSLSSSSSSLNRPNSLTGITSSYSRSSRDTEKEVDKREEEKEGEDKSQPRSIRDRRRPREKRRSTGVSFWTQDVGDSLAGDENDPDQQSDSEEGSTKGEPQVTRHSLTQTKMKLTEAGALQPVRQIKQDDTSV
ncbi:hypothetical protein INR49_005063 [Caranx melampygus]|nr:hypothetical protein INR49_005063 [Caranx melampygus]